MHHDDSSIAPRFSSKELELIRCLSEGLSSKETAHRMGISKNTVDTHRRNLLRKTGCKNTLELVVRCVKSGLL